MWRPPGAHGRASTDYASLEDERLVRRAGTGDGHAFAELYRRHQRLAWGVARATAASDEDAVAGVVEAFVHVGEQEPGLTFRAALAAAVRSATRARVRRRRGLPAREEVVLDLTAAEPRMWAPLRRLLHGVPPPPPPELWALVHVAWDEHERAAGATGGSSA